MPDTRAEGTQEHNLRAQTPGKQELAGPGELVEHEGLAEPELAEPGELVGLGELVQSPEPQVLGSSGDMAAQSSQAEDSPRNEEACRGQLGRGKECTGGQECTPAGAAPKMEEEPALVVVDSAVAGGQGLAVEAAESAAEVVASAAQAQEQGSLKTEREQGQGHSMKRGLELELAALLLEDNQHRGC